MNELKAAVIGMNNTRQLFYGIPDREINKKISSVIHREHFSFWIYKGLFVVVGEKRGPVLIKDISPEGDITVMQYNEVNQVLYPDKSLPFTIKHYDIQEPYNDFLDAEKERRELIQKLSSENI